MSGHPSFDRGLVVGYHQFGDFGHTLKVRVERGDSFMCFYGRRGPGRQEVVLSNVNSGKFNPLFKQTSIDSVDMTFVTAIGT